MTTSTAQARRFLMSDAMILIAATAIGFAEFRKPVNDWAERVLITAVSLLPAWSLACVLIRLRRPRPALSRLMHQPGTSASLAGGFPATFLHILALKDPERLMGYMVGSVFVAGLAVSAVWAAQMLGNELEPEASWVDRLGIALGFGWIVLFAFFCFPFILNG